MKKNAYGSANFMFAVHNCFYPPVLEFKSLPFKSLDPDSGDVS
jgi:hypothetical protein